jgi:sensor domain CHASE-containing protein
MKKSAAVLSKIVSLLNFPIVPALAALIVTLFLLSGSVIISLTTHQSFLKEERLKSLSSLGIVRSNIEGALNSRLLLGQGLVSYISVKPGLTAAEFEDYAGRLVTDEPIIRNLTVLKNTTIVFAYPLESNRKAIGIDLSLIPAQRDSVIKVIETGRTAVIANVNLVQGGVATVNRIPVYTIKGKYKKYWGQVSIVLMQDALFRESGLVQGFHGLRLSLRTVDESGESGEYLFGSDNISLDDAVELDVKFPHGTWRLAGAPEKGWGYSDNISIWYFTAGSVFSLITGILLFIIMKLGRRVQKLESILPICSECKKIRDDKGYWDSVDSFLHEHSKIQFSHSLCPDCADRLYSGQHWYSKRKQG